MRTAEGRYRHASTERPTDAYHDATIEGRSVAYLVGGLKRCTLQISGHRCRRRKGRRGWLLVQEVHADPHPVSRRHGRAWFGVQLGRLGCLCSRFRRQEHGLTADPCARGRPTRCAGRAWRLWLKESGDPRYLRLNHLTIARLGNETGSHHKARGTERRRRHRTSPATEAEDGVWRLLRRAKLTSSLPSAWPPNTSSSAG